jgi:hypothetical protein
LAVAEAPLPEALRECGPQRLGEIRRRVVEEPDHRHRRLLRARSERPCGSAAEQRDELASS